MGPESGDGDLLVARLMPGYALENSRAAKDDGRLVEAACRGDRGAFGILYDRYASVVHGVLLAKVPPGEVDDLVQEVFLTAMRRLSTLRDGNRFAAWLSAIARNLANDHYRHREPAESLTEDPPENTGERDAAAPDEAGAARILSVIRSLPEAYSETLLLRLVEGMTGPEIAAHTGLTHGSVRVNLCRGMQLLRARLADPPGNHAERQGR
jgi:RNA polymerase sigma-70 factor (ECF subfamily)